MIATQRRKLVNLLKRRIAQIKPSPYRESRRLGKIEMANTSPLSQTELRLALRGTVIHALPRLKTLKPIHCGRRAASPIKGGTMGTYNWCLTPCQNPNHWHRGCRLWDWMLGDGPQGIKPAANFRVLARWENLVPKANCNICSRRDQDQLLTLDHNLPIAQAARLGPRQFLRAFLPHNLQWLCRKCHAEKTDQDNAALREMKTSLGIANMPPRHGPNAPIQFPGQKTKGRVKSLGSRIFLPQQPKR